MHFCSGVFKSKGVGFGLVGEKIFLLYTWRGERGGERYGGGKREDRKLKDPSPSFVGRLGGCILYSVRHLCQSDEEGGGAALFTFRRQIKDGGIKSTSVAKGGVLN